MPGPYPAGHKMVSTDLNPVVLGWIDFLAWYGTTLAYVSADAPTFVFSIDADVTGVIEAGMRVKLTQATDKFFIVTAVGAFSGGVTPITVYGGTDYTLANAAISAGSFSTHKKPFGFNASPAKWTVEVNDATDRAAATPTLGTWFNLGSLVISLPIGAWSTDYQCAVDCLLSSGNESDIFATLSTANNSESDKDMTSHIASNVTATHMTATVSRRKLIAVAAKTSYFLNAKTAASSASSINFRGSTYSPSIIRAVCAYL